MSMEYFSITLWQQTFCNLKYVNLAFCELMPPESLIHLLNIRTYTGMEINPDPSHPHLPMAGLHDALGSGVWPWDVSNHMIFVSTLDETKCMCPFLILVSHWTQHHCSAAPAVLSLGLRLGTRRWSRQVCSQEGSLRNQYLLFLL